MMSSVVEAADQMNTLETKNVMNLLQTEEMNIFQQKVGLSRPV